MAPLASTRLAWSVAAASLALWAATAPLSWGATVGGAMHILENGTDQGDVESAPSTIVTLTPDPGTDSQACPPVQASPLPAPSTSTTSSGQQATFHLCGGDMQATERAIEQLIAGRGFSSSLSAHGDGCADLTIGTSSLSSVGNARSSLTVGVGSGKSLSIQMTSQGGTTHVGITQAG